MVAATEQRPSRAQPSDQDPAEQEPEDLSGLRLDST